MRRIRVCLFVLVLSVPVLSSGEIVLLKDGSVLRGEVLSFAQDTLQIRATFGGIVRVPRSMLIRIEFSDSAQVSAVDGTTSVRTGAEAPLSGVGRLRIEFDKVALSSTISVHRDRDRAGHERENVIETILAVDGKMVYSAADSTTDKVMRKGEKVLVRNTASPEAIEVELAAGLHNVSVQIANTRIGEYADRFDGAPLDEMLRVDSVMIRPEKVTRITVGLKRRKLGLGGKELRVVDNVVGNM